jgi:hypothetical protein
MTMFVIQIILGIAFLLLGGKLFLFLVGGAGFFVGYLLSGYLLPQQPEWFFLVVGGLSAILVILLLIAVKNILIGAAGFAAGAYLTYNLINLINPPTGLATLTILISGGVLGILLAIFLFKWALIFISAIIGSTFVVVKLDVSPQLITYLFILLVVIGVVIQSGLIHSNQPAPHKETWQTTWIPSHTRRD